MMHLLTGTRPALPANGTAAGPAISIIIPHLNQPELLRACLRRLQDQSFDMTRAEIIVVDNGSHELPCEVTRAFPDVVLARESEPGPGPARNRGVALSRAPVLAFTDSDCLPDRSWVAAILARFAAAPDLAILGGRLRVVTAIPEAPTISEAFDLLYGFRQRQNIAKSRFAATANMATRRAVFDAVGPFGGLQLSEDRDWGQRAARMGYRTEFAPEALVQHPARRTMAALHAQWGRHVSHFYRHTAGERLGRIRWVLAIPLMALSPLAEIPRVLGSRRLSGLRARGLAFAGLVDVRLFRAWRMLLALFDGTGGASRWNRH
jgi:GT2 family glycosyltransferase